VKNPTPGVNSITVGLTNDTGASPTDKITSNDRLFGTGAPNSIVQFSVDGTTIADTAAADATGAWNFTPTGLADGVHTIVASETDAAGNTGTASLTFTLLTAYPTVTEALESTTGGTGSNPTSSNPTLNGTADPNAVVQFTIDGTAVSRTATADATGSWNFTPAGLTPGVHTIVASETNIAGNTGLASLTFTLTPSNSALAVVTSATPVVLGDARVGVTASQALSLTNAAVAPAEDLDASVYSTTGAATASGSITGLAPGATDSSSIKVGVDTSSAGNKSGSVTLTLASDGQFTDGQGISPLPSQTITVQGAVYREATASVAAPAVNLVYHVGDLVDLPLQITNSAANDGFSENLRVAVDQTTGGIIAATPIGELAAQASGAATLGFSTAAAGPVSGSITLDFASDGVGIDGFAAIPIGTQTIQVNAEVDNFAQATWEETSGGGTFQQSGQNYTLDLGSVYQGASPITVGLAVVNSASGPADLLSGSFESSNSGAFTLSSFNNFAGLAAGQSESSPTVTFNTNAVGSFTETITLDPTGSNASGYSGTLAAETLTITGTVIPAIPDLTVVQYLANPSAADSAPEGFNITDTTAKVSSIFDILNADPHLDTITLTDTGAPSLTLTALQALDDTTALGKISNAGYGIAILDSAADVAAKLDALSADPTITTITLTDPSDPLAVSVAQITSDAGALGKLTNGYSLAVTDSATDIENGLAALLADASHIASIAASGTVGVSAATFGADRTVLDKIVGGFDIVDTAADIKSYLNFLSDPSIVAVTISDNAAVGANVAQLTSDATTIAELRNANGSAYQLAISDTAANVQNGIATLVADASHIGSITATGGPASFSTALFAADKPTLDKIVGGFGIADTAAKVSGSLDALQGDVADIASIKFSDASPPTLNITSAQLTADAAALAKIASPYILDVANGGGASSYVGYGNGLVFNIGGGTTSTIKGGGLNESFVFGAGFKTATISEFATHNGVASNDTISLAKSDFANWATLLADAHTGAGGSISFVSQSSGATLTLAGVSVAAFEKVGAPYQSEFSFHA
jgi:hypothetical protein